MFFTVLLPNETTLSLHTYSFQMNRDYVIFPNHMGIHISRLDYLFRPFSKCNTKNVLCIHLSRSPFSFYEICYDDTTATTSKEDRYCIH